MLDQERILLVVARGVRIGDILTNDVEGLFAGTQGGEADIEAQHAGSTSRRDQRATTQLLMEPGRAIAIAAARRAAGKPSQHLLEELQARTQDGRVSPAHLLDGGCQLCRRV